MYSKAPLLRFTPYSKYMFPPRVHCTLSYFCLSCSIFYLLLFSPFFHHSLCTYPYFPSLNFTCLLPVLPAVSLALLLSLSPLLFRVPALTFKCSPLPPASPSLCFPCSFLPSSPSLSVSGHVLASSEQNSLLTEAEARWQLRDGSYQL